ncbi:GTPase Era, mitochondrial isoform X1 [Diabrotica virgifera virgifera]|uniref:GTPase Era, mitochondrial n=1 Tax=Diabrotica virgifera virgifera TaxID=50390 RepID=A0A6P7GHP3_DIAVI|nr:GTPase Era, mitochondrial isoform X1 [Diabrotica virgifera virgifera]
MLCSCISRLLSKQNLLVYHCKALLSTVNENILSSSIPTITESTAPIYDTKLLKVAIIGMPNAGKSTLINGLMDRKVCPASSKVHTTRTQAKAIFTAEDTQIIFIDTPGLVNDREQKKFNLQKTFIRDYKTVSRDADIIGVIHDVSNIWTRERLDIKIIKLLETQKTKPSFLVLNKIDVLKSKRKLLDLTRNLTENSLGGKPIESRKFTETEIESKGWPYFDHIFMVSSLTGDGLEEIREYLIYNAKPGEWMFPGDTWTDQKAESVVINTVKAVLLNHMPQEIPYKLQPKLEYFNSDEVTGKINAVVLIKCPTSRIAKLLAGASDGRLRLITENVQRDLQDSFQNFVKIQIVPTPLADNE